MGQKMRLIADQLKGYYYLINEGGGIAHLAPDYEKLVTLGTQGITSQVNRSQGDFEPGSREWNFLEAVKIIAEALARFGDRYADLALSMAETEADPMRKEGLRAVEIANAVYHPTPFTSMLLEGCLEKGVCSTVGGAAYNFSGIQCVGPVDTGDALYAIERAVFIEKRITLPNLVAMLKKNIPDEGWRSYLRNLPKFGNDCEAVDRYTLYVIDAFTRLIEPHTNTRGGKYTVGLYSVTAHRYYGDITGALPGGRRKGESFASGIAPANGMDKNGPTAMLNSINRIDFTRFANGINLNIKFDPALIKGPIGRRALESLLGTY